ncbi:MAG TPA: divergent polysaccharide deacetylase family protein [Burkholderiales bacterium]|nr:divergent polysaccharide deacetylase family protein [Burkholderiales bacterium]
MRGLPSSRLLYGSLLGLFLLWPADGPAQAPAAPTVSIVIDDLGHNLREDRRAIALPAAVSVAILPHTDRSTKLAQEAHRAGKEILLHLPMDPDDEMHAHAGPGRIEIHMSAPEIAAMFAYDLQTVPHAVGVNNHMGSRLTQNAASMQALMRAIRAHGKLFFLDSVTSPNSVAARVAIENGVPALRRDIFLDNERSEKTVTENLQRLEALATRGRAIAIGHPYPETLAALERWLPQAQARGIRVVPLATMLKNKRD